MKLSLDWLRSYVPFDGSADTLTDLLVRAGLEVESIEHRGADFPNVIVAQIRESSPHPNADRLSVCKVDDGSGHPRQIVCGAKNYQVGDKIPLALPGAVLPGDFKIKTGKLRGVESEGMMCSAKELLLAEDADGLLILSADAPVGDPIASLYPPDAILTLEITSNRPDWLSHLGIAREVRAFTGAILTPPEVVLSATNTDVTKAAISAPDQCPFYSVRRISGVRVGPSPAWLKSRIESCGLRSINNVVDVTNFVMMEMGQPLHAFDAAKVNGPIDVRLALEKEAFSTLDAQNLVLAPTNLVIADSSSALALAGVMGGAASGVTADTTEVLLESALFDAPSIRKTARIHGLQTDSSYRFERGVDPDAVLSASARAAQLIHEVAGGSIDTITVTAGTLPPAPPAITLRPARCRNLLGATIDNEEIRCFLSQLGLTERDGSTTELQQWQIPSYRGDLSREVDLIEEVIRLAGIDRVPGVVRATPANSSAADAMYDEIMRVRTVLAGLGFSEGRTSTLVSRTIGAGTPVLEVRNPLGDDQSALRASLIDGLIPAMERNINHGASSIRLFEVGRIFKVAEEEELTTVALAVTGRRAAPSWLIKDDPAMDIFDLKGVIEILLPSATIAPATDPRFAAGWEIQLAGFVVGIVGIVHPATARAINARGPVVVAEIRMDAIASFTEQKHMAFSPIPRFPAVFRDLAVVAPLALPSADIQSALHKAKEPLLTAIDLFDVFTDPSGDKLPADRKSLAFSLTFRAPERTLTSEEVSSSFERVKTALKAALPVEFRE
jgi:phenylalanyl-tRNA synthetase beta chain